MDRGPSPLLSGDLPAKVAALCEWSGSLFVLREEDAVTRQLHVSYLPGVAPGLGSPRIGHDRGTGFCEGSVRSHVGSIQRDDPPFAQRRTVGESSINFPQRDRVLRLIPKSQREASP
jgi:hypothetical protein